MTKNELLQRVEKIIEAGRPSGLRLLREDGWLKVKRGMTTPDEVVRCTAQ